MIMMAFEKHYCRGATAAVPVAVVMIMMNIEWNFFRFLLDAPFAAQWFDSMFFWKISINSKFSD